jgi:intracellular sulfur oxidation DsrE/DsrF family protein
MKRIWAGLALVSALAGACSTPPLKAETADTARHRVVFELTSDDAQAFEGVLNNVENVHKALGPTSIVVVTHGKGLALLTASSDTGVLERLKNNADAGVVFAACENTMKRQNLTKEDLVPFATTVDSGVAEVVRKQEAGWSYVRSGS